jgi:hypothetical protein
MFLDIRNLLVRAIAFWILISWNCSASDPGVCTPTTASIAACVTRVPWISQYDPRPGTRSGTRNCGQSSVYMIKGLYSGMIDVSDPPCANCLTPDEIVNIDYWLRNYPKFMDALRLTSNGPNGQYTSDSRKDRLPTLASEKYGFVDSHYYDKWQPAQLLSELEQGHPVIVGVYTFMHKVRGHDHWMVLVGLDDTWVWVNDPGRSLANKNHAKYWHYSRALFDQAWGGQVVVIHPNQSPPTTGNGWRMSGYDGSRTNKSTVLGPVTQPSFQSLLSSVPGSLRRISKDGSLVLYDGTNLRSYTSIGGFKWTAAVGGVSDVAIGPSGTIYTSTPTTLSAWKVDTGQAAWPQPYVLNTGNETSPLAIDGQEVIYVVTGASYIGPTNKVTAINANGTLKWERGITFRGYQQFVLSTDESFGYIMDLVNTFSGTQVFEHGVSTSTGQDVYSITSYQDIRGNTYAFAPWNLLYTGQYNDQLVACAPTFSPCSDVNTQGVATGVVTLTSKGIIVVSYNTGAYTAISQSGQLFWTSSETLTGGFSDANGTLYAIAPSTNDIIAINPSVGQELWRQHFQSAVSALLLGDDGCLYASVGTTLFKGCPAGVPG